MADKPKKTRKKTVVKKQKDSLRQRNEKAAKAKDKPTRRKRARKAAQSAAKPVGRAANFLGREYHVLNQKEEPGFFTKSRSIVPSYVVKSLNELRFVTWPGRRETWKLVFAVFVFAMAMGLFIAVLDFAFEKVFREVIL